MVKTITKEKWVKDDNIVVSSSHPPLETIVINHRTSTVKASYKFFIVIVLVYSFMYQALTSVLAIPPEQ
jgi:hypothetical protein